MSSSDELHSAQQHLAAGSFRRALSAGWRAADAALREGDAATLREVGGLAGDIWLRADGRTAKEGQQLESYCRSALDGAGGGVESHSILSRLSRIRQPRRACPDCAEQIPEQARVCRYCGYRFPSP